MNRFKQFKQAAHQYIQKTQEEEEVIGMVISGSYVYGQLDKNSDIDIFVILHPNCTYRERGNTWMNGIEIEYFKNPPQQIRQYFKTEKSPHTADMLAKGKLVYENHSIVETLIEEARTIINTAPNAMSESAIELARYFLDDKFKDLEDALLNQDRVALNLIQMDIINYAIDTFCKLNRIVRTKHKRLYEQLRKINLPFAQLIQKTLKQPSIENMITLRRQMDDFLGGKRSKEWQFRSGLELK